MMKVLYIAHCADFDGSGRALLHLLEGLEDKVTPIVVLPTSGRLFQHLKQSGIQTIVLPYSIDVRPAKGSWKDYLLWVPRWIRTYLFRRWATYRVTRLVRREQVELVHTNSSVIHWGAVVARKCNVPHVWHVRECQDIGLTLCPLEGMTALKTEMAYPNNHCVAITRFVFQHHQLDSEKDVVIYDGVFHEDRLNVSDSAIPGNYFLYVGTLSAAKGCFDAIKAFERLAAQVPDVELWLAGDKNPQVMETIRTSPYSSRIKLLGFRKDIYELMQHARATLVPTFFEGFGFVTTEAMLNGCLVIGRNTAGTKEQLDNGLHKFGKEIGLRFNNVDELVSNMKWACLASDSEIQEYTDRGRKIVAQYTIERSCEQLLQLYTRLLKG